MLSAHWFLLILLVLAAPIYALLHALTLALPLYVLLLSIGVGLLYLCLRSAAQFEEVFGLSAIVIGGGCAIAGLAVAPLSVQGIAGTLLLASCWRYQVE